MNTVNQNKVIEQCEILCNLKKAAELVKSVSEKTGIPVSNLVNSNSMFFALINR